MTTKILTSALFGLALTTGALAQDSTSSAPLDTVKPASLDTLNVATAAPEPSPLKISGSVDAYYRYSQGAEGSAKLNNFTSFTNSNNTFQLGMASIKAEYTKGKAGAVIDLGFGTRAEEFSYADEGTLQAVKQAYIYFAPTDRLKFTFGKFGTHMGYELLDPQLNKNYSMSYMFTNGPFSHTGLKADFSIGKGLGLMVGVANPIDVTSPSDGSAPKTILAQISRTGEKLSAFLNYVGYFGATNQWPGASSLNQVGLTATYVFGSKFSLGYDGTIQMIEDETVKESKSWWGSALYFNYTGDAFGLTLRTEYFADKKYGLKPFYLGQDEFGTDIFQPADVLATTLSGNLKFGGFTLIPEIRFENATVDSPSAGIFSKNAAGELSKSNVSAVVAVVYSF